MGGQNSKCGVPNCDEELPRTGVAHCIYHQCMYCVNSKDSHEIGCLACICKVDECTNCVEFQKDYCCSHLCRMCKEKVRRLTGPLCEMCLREELKKRRT